MTMEWLFWMIAVAVLGLAAVAASGRLGELPPTVTSTPVAHVPTGHLQGDDLRAVRFQVVAGGYSMQQVDELLDRLARQLDRPPDADESDSTGPDRPGGMRLVTGGWNNGVSSNQQTSEVCDGSDETPDR